MPRVFRSVTPTDPRAPSIQPQPSPLQQLVFMSEKDKDDSNAPAVVKKTKKRTTEPRPFNLTKPKPKLPPPEEPAPEPYRAKPAPRFAEGPTKEEKQLEAAREQNRKAVQRVSARDVPPVVAHDSVASPA